uniref:Spermatogenesis associated 33 n=1 Tax=Ictidomys tridecemlineatus TaxID=43179 RepID=I3MIB0_ICTTR
PGGSSYSSSRSKDALSEKHSLEAEKLADTTKCLDVFFPLEKPDVKQKSNKKKFVIPQIIITRASNETLISYCSTGNEEQRTIREQADWGPYHRHRNPSTVAAYDLHTKE